MCGLCLLSVSLCPAAFISAGNGVFRGVCYEKKKKRKQRARSFHNTEGGCISNADRRKRRCTNAACSSIVWSLIDAPHSRTKRCKQKKKVWTESKYLWADMRAGVCTSPSVPVSAASPSKWKAFVSEVVTRCGAGLAAFTHSSVSS